uniref:proline-rich protein 2-like n=1 Tax=Callithrix jacchus TaxID=9483 RepID=UPI0023DD44A5|nr:proline-rich protein 2-like [Callithrix jacchus]
MPGLWPPASSFAEPASAPPPHGEVSAAGEGEGAGKPQNQTTITSPESGSQTRRPREGRRPRGPVQGRRARARGGRGNKVWKPRENFSKRKRGGGTGYVASPPQPPRPPDTPSAGKCRPRLPGSQARTPRGKGQPARRGTHARPEPNSRRRRRRDRAPPAHRPAACGAQLGTARPKDPLGPAREPAPAGREVQSYLQRVGRALDTGGPKPTAAALSPYSPAPRRKWAAPRPCPRPRAAPAPPALPGTSLRPALPGASRC